MVLSIVVTPKKHMDIDTSFNSLLSQTISLMRSYTKNCRDKNSWIHWYVKRIGIKLIRFNFSETKDEFIGKISYIYDVMIMSHYVVKVINPETYTEANLLVTKKEKERIVSGLTNLKQEEWPLFLDQLKGLQYGVN